MEFIGVDGQEEGTIRIDKKLTQIGGSKSIEIAIAIIKSQTEKVPVPRNKKDEWAELNKRVLADLEEMYKKAQKMENLFKVEKRIKEKERRIDKLRHTISELEAEIQKEQEQVEE